MSTFPTLSSSELIASGDGGVSEFLTRITRLGQFDQSIGESIKWPLSQRTYMYGTSGIEPRQGDLCSAYYFAGAVESADGGKLSPLDL